MKEKGSPKITELDCISGLKIHINKMSFIFNLQLLSVCVSCRSFVYWICIKSFISRPYSCYTGCFTVLNISSDIEQMSQDRNIHNLTSVTYNVFFLMVSCYAVIL